MARISVSLDDAAEAAIRRAAAGGSVSKWVSDLIRQALLDRAASAAASFDREHDDPDYEARRLEGAA